MRFPTHLPSKHGFCQGLYALKVWRLAWHKGFHFCLIINIMLTKGFQLPFPTPPLLYSPKGLLCFYFAIQLGLLF